ncbi:MAG: CoA transferase [Dehalococcoidia bacterium]|nr:CoA transferase [Dehalococcoidia bacterium]
MNPEHQAASPAAEPWAAVDGDPREFEHLTITGDANLPSAYRVTDVAVGSIGAATLAAAALWHDRGGPDVRVKVDRAEASVAFRSERYLRVNGETPADLWGPLAGDYRAADRWVRIHANFDHHRDAALRALGIPPGPETARADVEAAVAGLHAADLVERIMAEGGAAASWRTPEEWRSHPQGAAVQGLPLIALSRLGNAPQRPLPAADRPLEGLRVLDLSRVLAGPVCGRFLAAHGADVLRVSGPHLPTFPALDLDTGFGKRSCFVDLRMEDGRETLRALVRQADVFVQAYRPGALGALGFSPEALARLNPGLVSVQLSAYGQSGPWQDRRGFDSLLQMASGLVATETESAGHPDRPRSLPAQALDHATGYLAALGAIAALRRRHAQGGSWLVEVSLARTGWWLEHLGRASDGHAAAEPDPSPYLETTGSITHVRPPGRIPGAMPRWERPPPQMGEHDAAW